MSAEVSRGASEDRIAEDMRCSESTRSSFLARVLERIPGSRDDAVPIHDLCPFAMRDEPSCESCILAVLTFLHAFDAITVSTDATDGLPRIKARAQAASYFLKSLAVYIRDGLRLVSNWQRAGVGMEIPVHILSSGSQFVYLMERKRIVEYGQASAIRQESIGKAVIKALINGQREPVYLVQYDDKAHQFQLIGGRKRPADGDMLTVIKREIEEEMRQNHLVFAIDYQLTEIASDSQYKELSLTYGAYTEYRITTYQVFMSRPELVLTPHDAWVTRKELLAGATRDGRRIYEPYIADLEKQIRGGLAQLPLSFEQEQEGPRKGLLWRWRR